MLRSRRRGIALITVLMILGVLVSMTGAFVAINHSNFALMASAADQEEAIGACQAGYSYALYSLEDDKRFGRQFTSGDSPTAQQVKDVESLFTITMVNDNTLTGQIVGPDGEGKDSSFTLEVVNNLPLDSKNSTAKRPAAGGYPEVPPDCAFVRVTGTAGGVTRTLETMVTYAPLFDASATADSKIDINASEGLTIDSLDLMRNLVRSNKDIDLFGKSSGQTRFKWKAMEDQIKASLLASGVPASEVDAKVEEVLRRKGSLKAKGEILVKNQKTSDDLEFRAKQEDLSRGIINPNTKRESQLLDIKFDDFRMADSGAAVADIRPGLYVFGSADYAIGYDGTAIFQNANGDFEEQYTTGSIAMSFPALERQTVKSTSGSDITATTTEERWIKASSLPKEGSAASDFSVPTPPYTGNKVGLTFKGWKTPPVIRAVVDNYGDTKGVVPGTGDKAKLHVIDSDKVDLADISATPQAPGARDTRVTIDIETAEFRVQENVMLNSAGPFGVLAERDRFSAYGDDSFARNTDAKLKLGVTAATMQAAEAVIGAEPSAVKADGRIRVRNVRGRGALVANDDLTVAAGGDTVADELALYSTKDVILDPKANLEGQTYLETEVTTMGAPVDSIFRGLVYAGRDFIVGNAGYTNDVKIEGSLVAKRQINIMDAKHVKLTYNPIFSRKMLKDRPDFDVRLERQSYNLY